MNNEIIKPHWLEQILNSSYAGILVINKKREILYVNSRICEMYGYEKDELLKSSAEILHISKESYERFAQVAVKFALASKPIDIDYRLKRKDGTYFWTHMSGNSIKGTDETVWTAVDITPRKVLELKNIQQGKIIETIHDSIVSIGLDQKIIQWNEGAENLLGYKKEEMLGKNASSLFCEKAYDKFVRKITLIMNNKKHSWETAIRDKNGDKISIDLSLALLEDEDSKPLGAVGYIKDIRHKKEALKALRYQANHDALTKLPNRLLFHDRLEQAIEKASKAGTTMALFFLDLDHFKEINDSLGHKTGDEVLKVVADRLEENVRKKDTLARLGGDEFTIIIDDLKEGRDASKIAQKIVDVLARPIFIDENELYVSSSIGISLFPDNGNSVQDLLKYADSAMYKAKSEGRNNYQFYSSDMTELATQRVVMEAGLRAALKNEEFVVYYQPQVNALKEELIGMEALVRWEHATEGIISPAKFIPLAEATGLIVDLDRFVMKQAMKQISTWHEDGLNPGRLALNLAVKQLQQKDFIEFLKNTMLETGCKSQWIELEVTEGQIMTNPEEAIKILDKITDLGIELAVDDFGTGYSSLAYLKKLPIDKLKIDQSFIRDLPQDEEDAAITKAVIALASSLNLKIIAEGVETEEQKEFLIDNGCVYIQGYLYSKPIEAKDMELMLSNERFVLKK
ncbi:MAG: EAL domain-containing protein [Sulfurimonas sp.]|nr:EAL domain-containing protein [Sulfurimonas sp.]